MPWFRPLASSLNAVLRLRCFARLTHLSIIRFTLSEPICGRACTKWLCEVESLVVASSSSRDQTGSGGGWGPAAGGVETDRGSARAA